jgi:pyridoxine 4-dehydrogenase
MYLCAYYRLVEDKKAKQLGVSNYGPKTLKKVVDIIEMGGGKVQTNQVQFSLLSRLPIESGLSDVCGELGIQPIGIHVYIVILFK